MTEDTHVRLKEYIEKIFEEKEKAINLLALNLEYRLDSLNALRTALEKDRNLFVTKEVYEKGHEFLTTQISTVQSSQSKIIGGAVVLAGICGFIGAIISHLLK